MAKIRNLAVLFSLVFLAACGGQLDVDQLLERADQSISRGEYKAAVTDLKAVVQQQPKNVSARNKLGDIYLLFEDAQSAKKEFLRVVEYAPGELDVYPKLAKSLLLAGDFQDLIELELPSELSKPMRSLALSYKAVSSLSLEVSDQARQYLNQALELDASNMEAALGTAMWHHYKGDLASTYEWIEKAKVGEGDIARVWSFLGYIEAVQEHDEKAHESYSEAIRLKKRAPNELMNRSLLRVRLGDLDGAQKDLNALDASFAGHPQVLFSRGLIAYQKTNYQSAVEHFEKALAKYSSYPAALLYAGSSHYLLKNSDIAADYLNKYLSLEADNIEAQKMLASNSILLGDAGVAEKLINNILKQNPDDAFALEVLADSYLLQGQFQKNSEIREKILALEPESQARKVQVADAYIKAGRITDAIAVFQSIYDEDPASIEANRNLIMAYRQNGQFDQALAVADRFKVEHPDSIEPLLLAGSVYMDWENLPEATRVFNEVLSEDPKNLSAYSGLAAVFIAQGQFGRAEDYYQQALKHDSDDLETLLNIATLQFERGLESEAGEKLERAAGKHPDSVAALSKLVRFYEQTNQHKEILSVLQAKSIERIPYLLSAFAEAKLRTGDLSGAEATLLQYIQKYPKDAQARYSLAMLQGTMGDYRRYAEGIAEAYNANPQNVAVLKEWVSVNTQRGQFEESENLIKQLEKITGERADTLALRGELHEARGNSDTATLLFEQAFEEANNNHNLIRWTNALWNRGQQDKAVELLEGWLTKHPKDQIVLFDLANRHFERSSEKRAVELFETLIGLGSENVIVLNNLAWLLKDHSPEKAEKHAAKAVQKAPQMARLQDTYAVVLVNRGKLEKAKDVIDQAHRLEPANSVIAYHRAMILSKLGDKQRAIEELLKLLEVSRDFPKRKEAETLLAQLEGN
ncbi:PEP-CTERM system TPR-repeat protein PrsT [Pseudomaricurvus alkylphenolicus]|uniref:XrtA/PEP-CTERM system TPR-repeat protein PrsT n=1 Tax=Pseudomaricurvus alkylphenolicus TaxID=1306991 RepID=UPI001423CC4E|nr:XrtA/PEP-CTERM system TPR-repeat protein PrsT [Pseudomaricurvus alkylphenolicus]NIB43152.1 PEP-CTERM system TPR-repeat protein PrsT [Pseudomaricurvus alkylphenolicus]